MLLMKLVSIVSVLLVRQIHSKTTFPVVKQYGAIIDAGSSGSRIRIYEWVDLKPEDVKPLPTFEEILSFADTPGISSYSKDYDGLKTHLTKLLKEAIPKIPAERHKFTHIHLMATAGMRLILEEEANNEFDEIDKILSYGKLHNFIYTPKTGAKVLSGEEEGVFGWLAVNYLKGVFIDKNVRAKQTFGILEMGGASTQIVFEPSGILLEGKYPQTIGKVRYELYAHSYLYYGQNSVSDFVKEQLYIENPSLRIIEDPCLLKGDTQVYITENGKNITYKGDGNYQKCELFLKRIVYKDEIPWHCHPKPCAIGTQYQPKIDNKMKFVAIGAFKYSFKPLGFQDGRIDLEKVHDKEETYCSKTLQQANQEYKVNTKFASMVCLGGLYSSILFTKGYAFEENTDQISSESKINNIPAGNLFNNKFPLRIGNVKYELYAHSYLYYGQNSVDVFIKEQLHRTLPQHNVIQNPCLLKGDKKEYTTENKKNITYLGVGNFKKCENLLKILVYKNEIPWRCNPKPCARGTQYQPNIDKKMEFVALGAFKYAYKSLGLPDGNVDLRKVHQKEEEYCSKTVDKAAEENHIPKSFASMVCLGGLYSPILFTQGYSFDIDTQQISATTKIMEIDAEWTLGAIITLYMEERTRT